MIENTINIQELRKQITEDVCNGLRDMLQSQQGYMPMNLDNCTDASQSVLEGENPMAYERTRVYIGLDNHGKPVYTQISGKTQDQRNDNIVKAYITSGRIWDFIPMHTAPVPVLRPKKTSPSYREVAIEWAEDTQNNTEEGTKDAYKSYLKHSLEYFASTPVHEIKVKHIQKFLNTRIGKDEDFLSKGTIRNIWNIVQQVLDYAVAQEYIDSNPARNNILRNPSDKESKRTALSKAELLEIRKAIPTLKTDAERLYMLLLTSMPYRRGEALGQHWEDIDFEQETARITGTVAVIKGKAKYRKKAKTDSSLRTMTAPPFFMESLKEYRKPSGFIVNNNGNHLTANEIADIWDSISEQIPIIEEKGLTPHYFRHTLATIMYQETNDVISVAAQCGHADGGRTTQKVYLHDDIESRRKAVQRMEESMDKSA